MQTSIIQVKSADGLPRQSRDGRDGGLVVKKEKRLERLREDARGTKTDRALITVESKLQGRARSRRMLNSQVPQTRVQSE
jgi:hypothetical protein